MRLLLDKEKTVGKGNVALQQDTKNSLDEMYRQRVNFQENSNTYTKNQKQTTEIS